ncbi:hypothetical protein [Candidatus Clavichlamydia salmonicola]|uniref:hypothetical protein n=1 Tax=Candidatus Clavichlamydia salmonicola TaxID=469812 RepID=UPI0018910835|nr:hypothetical protein [Candidatus Clavichlamydia salmonicola]
MRISFWTPLFFYAKQLTLHEFFTEKIDNYFDLFQKKAIVLPSKYKIQNQRSVLSDLFQAPLKINDKFLLILKITSYFSLIIPILMLLAKTLLRKFYILKTVKNNIDYIANELSTGFTLPSWLTSNLIRRKYFKIFFDKTIEEIRRAITEDPSLKIIRFDTTLKTDHEPTPFRYCTVTFFHKNDPTISMSLCIPENSSYLPRFKYTQKLTLKTFNQFLRKKDEQIMTNTDPSTVPKCCLLPVKITLSSVLNVMVTKNNS